MGLWSAISRDMFVIGRDSGGHGTCWKEKGDPRERLCLQLYPFAHLTVAAVHPYTSHSSLAFLPLSHTLHTLS